MVRKVLPEAIVEAVSSELVRMNTQVPKDLIGALTAAHQVSSAAGRLVMDDLLENAAVAEKKRVPLCQDTGMAVFFVRIGTEVLLSEPMQETLNRSVALTYRREGYRPSVVKDPIIRDNSGDNSPVVVYIEQVTGDEFTVELMVKGFGSENMSRLSMLRPADGYEGVADFVLDTIRRASGNPCPPLVIGVGVGGTFEQAPLLAKRALLRTLGSRHADPNWAERESDLLRRINQLDIGPGGLGGGPTALAVHFAVAPTHIAALPVAVNICCHASRHGRVVL